MIATGSRATARVVSLENQCYLHPVAIGVHRVLEVDFRVPLGCSVRRHQVLPTSSAPRPPQLLRLLTSTTSPRSLQGVCVLPATFDVVGGKRTKGQEKADLRSRQALPLQ